MTTFQVISRNILSSWVAYAIQVVVTFFLTPFILSEIGDTRYGVWAIVVSITGYYGLLDLGLRAGITQYITRYFASGDLERMNKAASSGLALHVGCAICVVLVTLVSVAAAPSFFSFSGELKSEAVWCVAIVGCSTALQFLLFPFSVALAAKQRFDIIMATEVMARLLSAAGMYFALKFGYGLVGLCIAAAVSNALDYVIRGVISARIIPELRMSWRMVNRESCRECIAFASWSALIATSTLVIGFTDAILIGFFMPAAAITFFALANNLIRYFVSIFAPVGHVFFPAATALDASNNVDGLQRMYVTASRMVALQATGIALVSCFWAGDFYSLWVGDAYLNSMTFHPVPFLFRILMIGAVFTAAQRIGSKVLLGRRRTKGMAWLTLGEASLNLGISVSLIGRYGLLGVAIGTVIPAVLCQGVLLPVMVCSNLKLRLADYMRDVMMPTVLTATLLVPLLGIFHRITQHGTWAALGLEGFVATVIAIVVACSVGLTKQDRHRFLYPSIRKIPGFRFSHLGSGT